MSKRQVYEQAYDDSLITSFLSNRESKSHFHEQKANIENEIFGNKGQMPFKKHQMILSDRNNRFEGVDVAKIVATRKSVAHEAFRLAAFTVIHAYQKEQMATAEKERKNLKLVEGKSNDVSSSSCAFMNALHSMELVKQCCFKESDTATKKLETGSSVKSTKQEIAAKSSGLTVPSAKSSTPFKATGITVTSTQKQKGVGPLTVAPTKASATMDARATVARAILCAAGCLSFCRLTSKYEISLDPLEIPQNTRTGTGSSVNKVNMGAVMMKAQVLVKRAVSQTLRDLNRGKNRFEFAMHSTRQKEVPDISLAIPNPFAWDDYGGGNFMDDYSPSTWGVGKIEEKKTEDHYPVSNDELVIASHFSKRIGRDDASIACALSDHWRTSCLPRLLNIVTKSGTGHAIMVDKVWTKERMVRVYDFFHALASSEEKNYGLHLVVCNEDVFTLWESAFSKLGFGLQHKQGEEVVLRTLSYKGNNRMAVFRHLYHLSAYNTPHAPVHIVIMTYPTLIEDFSILCQISWQCVVLDDGYGWLGSASGDPNGHIGKAWDALWNKRDFVSTVQDHKFPPSPINEGLTARHRFLTCKSLTANYRGVLYPSVSGLISFLCPQFDVVTREEWDRSRINNDTASIKYFRSLLARFVAIHLSPEQQRVYDTLQSTNLMLAQQDIEGVPFFPNNAKKKSADIPPPELSEKFLTSGKIMQSRRFAISWLSHCMRYEFAKLSFQPMLRNKSQERGAYVCEEIVMYSSSVHASASNSPGERSITSISGGCSVAGLLGATSGMEVLKLAVKCGRTFTSEQGLRQHMAALHAPPGTWLCRNCGSDCGTSQARTHHERYCSNLAGTGFPIGQGGGGTRIKKENEPKTPSTTPSQPKSQVSVASTKTPKSSATNKKPNPEADKDGSMRVPSYRGVWITSIGRHFIKIRGTPMYENNLICFDTAEEAAKFYDQEVKRLGLDLQLELNHGKDGDRIVYDDAAGLVPTGGYEYLLGGNSASSVVPALSVINIKDLPSGVVPLLRDPKQVSRIGNNSKRFVYKYRGVCRQARKGHDRWQSQISFGGTNHYLGTFDSERDAAAIYAWAHLILYGEDATKKAQLDGEKAYAAYEQEQKDIKEGKVQPPPPPPSKRGRKKASQKATPAPKQTSAPVPKPQPVAIHVPAPPLTIPKNPATQAPSYLDLFKTHNKSWSKDMLTQKDNDLILSASSRLSAAKKRRLNSTLHDFVGPVSMPVPFSYSPTNAPGCLLLIGLSPQDFQWEINDFLYSVGLDQNSMDTTSLHHEYGIKGCNASFKCLLRGAPITLGCASKSMEEAVKSLNKTNEFILGSYVGLGLDCHIGGPPDSCSTAAAKIEFDAGSFHLIVCNDSDIVSVNGQRLSSQSGRVQLNNEDICGVGSRVFLISYPSG